MFGTNLWGLSVVASLAAILIAVAACDTSTDAPYAPDKRAAQPPKVVSGASSLTVREGAPAFFSVTAKGAEPMTYQWQVNGVEIPGASERFYVLRAATLADDGANFTVRITNEGGSVSAHAGQLFVVGKDETLPWL